LLDIFDSRPAWQSDGRERLSLAGTVDRSVPVCPHLLRAAFGVEMKNIRHSMADGFQQLDTEFFYVDFLWRDQYAPRLCLAQSNGMAGHIYFRFVLHGCQMPGRQTIMQVGLPVNHRDEAGLRAEMQLAL